MKLLHLTFQIYTSTMLLRTIIILTFLCTFSAGYTRSMYFCERALNYFIPSVKNYPLCICKDGTCDLNITRAEEVCTVYKKRAMKYVDPSPYLFYCEVYGPKCTQSKTEPPEHAITIFVDAYSADLAFGQDEIRDTGSQLVHLTKDYPNPLLSHEPHRFSMFRGSTAFPVNFEGILKVPKSDIHMFKYCAIEKCRSFMTKFCADFADQMRLREKGLMDVYMGCRIREVVSDGDIVQMSWSMNFGYSEMIDGGIASTRSQLQNLIDRASSNITISSLKKYTMTGFFPMDYCEVRATSKTIQTYENDMMYATSDVYRAAAKQYRTWLGKQFKLGGKHCIEYMTRFAIFQNGTMAQVQMDLWVSLKCASMYRLNDCKDITKHVAKRWRTGDKKWRNIYTPTYEFKLVASGKPLP